MARGLQLRSDVRSSERRLDPQVPRRSSSPVFVIANRKAVDGDTVERLEDIESDGLLGCTDVKVGGEVPGRYESRRVPWGFSLPARVGRKSPMGRSLSGKREARQLPELHG